MSEAPSDFGARLQQAFKTIIALYRDRSPGLIGQCAAFVCVAMITAMVLAGVITHVMTAFHGVDPFIEQIYPNGYIFLFYRSWPIAGRIAVFFTSVVAILILRSRAESAGPWSFAHWRASFTGKDVERFLYCLAVLLLVELVLFKRPFGSAMMDDGPAELVTDDLGYSYMIKRVIASWLSVLSALFRSLLPWFLGFVLVGICVNKRRPIALLKQHKQAVITLLFFGFFLNAALFMLADALREVFVPVQNVLAIAVPAVPMLFFLSALVWLMAWSVPAYAGVFVATAQGTNDPVA